MKLYLDTCVIRDYLENRNQSSSCLIEKIKQLNFHCLTSAFSIMELSDLQKDTIFFHKKIIDEKWDIDKFLRERRQKLLSKEDFRNIGEYLNETTKRLLFLEFTNIGENGWNIARYISANSSLSAVDTIHLVAAYTAGCNLLVTTDTQFIKCGNEILKISKRKSDISVLLPEEAFKKF